MDLTGLKVIGFAPGFLPGFGHLASPPKRSLLGIVVTRVTGRGRQLRSTGRREMDRRRRLGEGRDGQRDRRTGGWGEGRDEEGRTEGQEEHGRPGSLGAAWSAAAHSWDLLQCVQSTPCGGAYPLSEESSACVLCERLVCARGLRREERPRDPCVSVSVPLAGHGPLDPHSTQASAHTGRRVVSLTERGGTGEREVDYRVTTACSSARRGSYDERVEHEQNGEPHFLASCMLNHTKYHVAHSAPRNQLSLV